MKMECLHLSVVADNKICKLMANQRLDGTLDEFDIKHYCKGNPNLCYFHRLHTVQKPANRQPEENQSEAIQVDFDDQLLKPKLEEAEISLNLNEPPPLYFELIRRGFRHRVKLELEDTWVIKAMKEK